MSGIIKAFKHLAPVLFVFAFLSVSGCEGTDTREKMDDTIEEFAGKKNLDRMEQMKKDINKAQKQQEERIKKTEEGVDEK